MEDELNQEAFNDLKEVMADITYIDELEADTDSQDIRDIMAIVGK